ncbi:MAG: 4-hydroxybenzoate 3-monooxygenase, partial [Rhodanobacteraceae bacterium]
LAISDAKQLADGFRRYYEGHDSESLDRYGERALSRVWKAVRFSWWMTNLTHRISAEPIERQIQLAELEFTRDSVAAQTAIAENFWGLD